MSIAKHDCGHGQVSLKVIVVGGGIGGMAAAIALRQQGHEVKIYEQSRFADETGAAIHLVPNAISVLNHLDVYPEEHGANELRATRLRKHTGEVVANIDHSDRQTRYQKKWLLTHRAHLHEHLKTVAISTKGRDIPVQLVCTSKIRHVEAQQGIVYLSNGEQDQADVIIGADGVHSVCRKAVSEQIPTPHPSGKNTFRFLLTREELESDPETRTQIESPGCMDMWYASDRKVVIYPCANNKLLNFVCIHPATWTDGIINADGTKLKSVMLSTFSDFHPALIRMLNKADPSGLKIWPLLDMEALPRFHAGRLALIGDAAHPFLPHLGQGAAMAIEDGASIGIMLSRGVTPQEVPERIALYNEARYERATLAQKYTRLTGEDGIKSSDNDSLKLNLNNTLEYFIPHDEVHASTQLLRQHLWKQQKPSRWRQPTVFGPMPGPRQNIKECRQSGASSSVTTATIKFSTSATLLQNLFPSKAYAFSHGKSIAEMSFSVQQLSNLAWLGGGGYNSFSLYIHDVRYTKQDGSHVDGVFCPVTFEDLADSIITDREELCWPKLYSSIEVSRPSEDSMNVWLSWRGAKWASLWIHHLRDASADGKDTVLSSGYPVPLSPSEEGLLLRRFMPNACSSNPCPPDAEYDVFFPRPVGNDKSEIYGVGEAHSSRPVSFVSQDSGVQFYPLGWEKLPTINHIVSRIAELPQFGVSSASLNIETGARDFTGGYRIS